MATILAVDDSTSVRKMIDFALKSRGHTVTLVADGQEAMEALERQDPPFDLVVLDINMPCLDGLSFLGLVRQREEWDKLSILMLTTEGQDADRQRALSLGATDYMVKPFKPTELLDRIDVLLEKK